MHVTTDNSLFKAAQCFLIWLGVKWRKFGIFISSMLAYLPGGIPPCSDFYQISKSGSQNAIGLPKLTLTRPWRTGNGTAEYLKVLAVGQTSVHSWSTGIDFSRGGISCNKLQTNVKSQRYDGGWRPYRQFSWLPSLKFIWVEIMTRNDQHGKLRIYNEKHKFINIRNLTNQEKRGCVSVPRYWMNRLVFFSSKYSIQCTAGNTFQFPLNYLCSISFFYFEWPVHIQHIILTVVNTKCVVKIKWYLFCFLLHFIYPAGMWRPLFTKASFDKFMHMGEFLTAEVYVYWRLTIICPGRNRFKSRFWFLDP